MLLRSLGWASLDLLIGKIVRTIICLLILFKIFVDRSPVANLSKQRSFLIYNISKELIMFSKIAKLSFASGPPFPWLISSIVF